MVPTTAVRAGMERMGMEVEMEDMEFTMEKDGQTGKAGRESNYGSTY